MSAIFSLRQFIFLANASLSHAHGIPAVSFMEGHLCALDALLLACHQENLKSDSCLKDTFHVVLVLLSLHSRDHTSGPEIFLPCSALVQQSGLVWIGRNCQQGKNHETSLWHRPLFSVSTFNILSFIFLCIS